MIFMEDETVSSLRRVNRVKFQRTKRLAPLTDPSLHLLQTETLEWLTFARQVDASRRIF